MSYPEGDFNIDIAHLTVRHRPTGTVFRFDGYPDPFNGNEVQVNVQGGMSDSELPRMCNAAALHLKARLDRTRS